MSLPTATRTCPLPVFAFFVFVICVTVVCLSNVAIPFQILYVRLPFLNILVGDRASVQGQFFQTLPPLASETEESVLEIRNGRLLPLASFGRTSEFDRIKGPEKEV